MFNMIGQLERAWGITNSSSDTFSLSSSQDTVMVRLSGRAVPLMIFSTGMVRWLDTEAAVDLVAVAVMASTQDTPRLSLSTCSYGH